MITLLKRLFQRRSRYPQEPTGENINRAIHEDDGACVFCGGRHMWMEGPSGGMMTNLMCGCCGQKINYSPVGICEDLGYDPSLRESFLREPHLLVNRHKRTMEIEDRMIEQQRERMR